MAIDSISGYSSTSNMTPTAYAEKKTVESENASVQASAALSKSVELATQIRQNEIGQEGNDGNTSKENTENHLKSVLSVANQKIRVTNTRCEFEYHEAIKRVSIKVIDKQTDEVIREIPPEESLEMVEKMWELAGLIVDERC